MAEPAQTASAAAPRPTVLSLVIKTKAALYSAYIPFVKGGGLFIPCAKECRLGDEVIVLLSFLDEPNRVPLTGSVCWINPAHATGGRAQGMGIQLPDSETGKTLKAKIEGLVAGTQGSGKATLTI